MDDRLDAILSEYEELWRRAALLDLKQMNVAPFASGAYGSCAWLHASNVRRYELQAAAGGMLFRWRCPLSCGCGEVSRTYPTRVLAEVMVHLNNVHRWTWDMFAGKFRDALEAGMIKGPDHA